MIYSNFIIAIGLTLGIIFVLFLFVCNPKEIFSSKLIQTLTSYSDFTEISTSVLKKLPEPLPDEYVADALFCLPAYFSELTSFLRLYNYPGGFWADAFHDTLILIGSFSALNQFNNGKRELALQYQKGFYKEMRVFLNEFRICLEEKNPERCSKEVWILKKSLKKWEEKLRGWSSP